MIYIPFVTETFPERKACHVGVGVKAHLIFRWASCPTPWVVLVVAVGGRAYQYPESSVSQMLNSAEHSDQGPSCSPLEVPTGL